MRILLILAAVLVCSYASAEQPTGVDEKGIEETKRRGPDVEPLGVIQAGPDAAIRKAFAPPADDSDKWWVNLILAGDKASDQEKAASKLLHDDIHGLKFKDFVKPEDPANSWAHYQERRDDDPLQQDWLAPIRAKVKETGLPCIVIQPPRNEKFGPHNRTVCVVGQYDGRPCMFASLIRERVEAYIYKHANDGTIADAALPPNEHLQSDTAIEARPPFDLPEPVAYPEAKDLPKKTLSFEQIRKKFPTFTPADAAHYADLGLTEQEILDAEKKFEKDLVEVNKTPVNPTPEVTTPVVKQPPSAGGEILTVGILAILVFSVFAGLWLYQQRNQAGQTAPKIDIRGNSTT